MAADLGLTVEQFEANRAAYDPTDPALEPWKLSYMFVRDVEKVDALPGDNDVFFANVNGVNTDLFAMLIAGGGS